MKVHLDNVQDEVDRRTKQVQIKHGELLVVNEKIREQNTDIIASIKYAQRIQNAMLPSEMEMNHVWKDHFIFYRPKDIVSGDFYWSYTTKSWKSNKVYFALGDCTGHGVPGAFLSVLGANTLNNIMSKASAIYPYEILVELNSRLRDSLCRTGLNGVSDGMDIGLCMIDEENNSSISVGP